MIDLPMNMCLVRECEGISHTHTHTHHIGPTPPHTPHPILHTQTDSMKSGKLKINEKNGMILREKYLMLITECN